MHQMHCQQEYTLDALRNVVPYVQFKKREKHTLSSVTFSSLQLYLK